MKKTLVLYTHTDMSDIWNIFFDRTQKYLNEYQIIVMNNEIHKKIPDYCFQIKYDDTQLYTERVKSCLKYVTEETILFLHEDMILYDYPKYDYLELYTNLVNEGTVNSVKLISVGEVFFESKIESTLVYNEYSNFSVQPTIIKTNTLLEILSKTVPLNIWDFEKSMSIESTRNYMTHFGNESKRGKYHYDSIVFPYIATAISKGKWNYSEYKNELDLLFTEYNIDFSKRGVI